MWRRRSGGTAALRSSEAQPASARANSTSKGLEGHDLFILNSLCAPRRRSAAELLAAAALRQGAATRVTVVMPAATLTPICPSSEIG
ncbi:ribose-phosphate pyrophosphokinase-like domain-containing protein [Rhodoblastus acidophilus]|uniref:ribose-phosphate pyrophosphokinase-like domain-containing protein n=1 Tax=Rhodoblastus acidophilus TaxID=1074 RepID=UPI003CD005A2